MKQKILIEFSILFLLFVSPVYAQTNLIIKFDDGTEKNTVLSQLSKLTFSTGNLVLNYNSVGTDSYAVSSVQKIFFSVTSGIPDVSTSNVSYLIYPNPADQFIRIKNIPDGKINVQIYRLDGVMIKSSALNSSTDQIDVSTILPGFYFLKINNKVLKFTKK